MPVENTCYSVSSKIVQMAYPGYDALIASHIEADPLAPAIERGGQETMSVEHSRNGTCRPRRIKRGIEAGKGRVG